MPDSIGKLSQLRELWLLINQLTHLPDSIGNLSQLQEFNLDKNQLTLLPDSIGNLSHLRKISFSDNPFLARADWPEKKLALIQKNLVLRCLFADLPYPPATFPTTITNVNQIISHCRNYRIELRYNLETHTLDLSNLPIKSIAPHIFKQIAEIWPDLEVIDLTGTPIAQDVRSCSELRNGLYVLAQHTKLNTIIVSKDHVIKKEHITSNEFERWTTPTRIENLDQIRPYLLFIDDNSSVSVELAKLDLESIDDSVFSQIAEAFPDFNVSLDLSCNPRLEHLPAEILKIQKLFKLSLHNTNIHALPEGLLLKPSLFRIVNFDYTPLVSTPEWKDTLARINRERTVAGLEELLIIDHAIPTAPIPVSDETMEDPNWRLKILEQVACRQQLHLAPFQFFNPYRPTERCGELYTATPQELSGTELDIARAEADQYITHLRLQQIRDAASADGAARALTPEERAGIAQWEDFIGLRQVGVGESKSGE